MSNVPVILDALKSIANSVDSITKPPLDFKSTLNSLPPDKSNPSPAVYELDVSAAPSTIPPEDTFHEEHWSDDRFDKKLTDTLDVNGGQEDLGEDKRAV